MSTIPLEMLLADYLGHLEVKRYSPATLRAYRRFIRRLILFVREHGAPRRGTEGLTPQLLKAWLREVIAENRSPRSVGGAVAAVRSWCKFLVRNGHLEGSPAIGLQCPRFSKPLPFVPSEADVRRLLATPAGDDWKAVRCRALLAVFYGTGCRISEVAGMNVLDVRAQVVQVLGKGQKERLVILGETARAALAPWLAHRQRLQCDSAESALFVSYRGRRLTTRSIECVVVAAVKAAGLDARITAHTLRHAMATHCADHGMDLRLVGALLGHASMNSTQVYVHTSATRLQEVHRKALGRE